MDHLERAKELLEACEKSYNAGSGWVMVAACHALIYIAESKSERYMELPLDADGVPIHVGAVMERADGGPSHRADCVCSAGFNDAPIWCARDFRHVRPQTLEDVMRDFAEEWTEACGTGADEIIARYAQAIRELMEGAK